MLLTRSPLYSSPCGDFLARLACVRHAASVRSEPGSNSPRLFGLSTNERSRTIPSWRTEMEMHMCPPHKLVAMIFDCQRTETAGSRASRHLTSRTSRPESRAPLVERPPATGDCIYQIPRKLSSTFIGLFFQRTSSAGLLLPATTLAPQLVGLSAGLSDCGSIFIAAGRHPVNHSFENFSL